MFKVELFLETLPVVLWGMLGIFIVLGIIFFVIKLFSLMDKKNKEE